VVWQSPLGGPANDRTSRFPLTAKGDVRWRVPLPYDEVTGISVTAEGTCFVSAAEGITALDGPAVGWSVATGVVWSPLLLDDGLFVTGETDGLTVREQRSGRLVNTIEVSRLRSDPVVLPNGLVAFLTSRGSKIILRAMTVTGGWAWEQELIGWSLGRPLVQADHVVVADGATLRAFSAAGDPVWTIELGALEGRAGDVGVDGPLVGLPDGRVLTAFRTPREGGYALVDTGVGTVEALPTQLPAKSLAVPLADEELGQDLLVAPGWPARNTFGQFFPAVVVVDIATGDRLTERVVPWVADSMAAGSTGVVAVAGSPSVEHWAKYHRPGFELTHDCYVVFLDSTRVRGEWKPERPVAGPLAVGPDGDLLVPLSGELVSLE
jgi:putative pyrroloquinoline-quinone binding quinoprotein